MMVCENDKFQIPKEYLKMSASELERLANEELKKMKEENSKSEKKPDKLKESPIVFNW